MPFDSIVSIGGQSLVGGVSRLLQPALQSLTNPLPVSVPGLTNTWVRVLSIRPYVARSSLTLDVELEARGEILLTASVRAGTLRLTLGTMEIDLPQLDGQIGLPTDVINVQLPNMAGDLSLPAPPRTQRITLTPEAPLTPGGSKDATTKLPITPGTLKVLPNKVMVRLPESLGDIGLPLPAVVPLAINLTPTGPTQITKSFDLLLRTPVDAASAFGLLLEVFLPSLILPPNEPPATAVVESISATISEGLRKLLRQFDVPDSLLPDAGPTTEAISLIATNIATAARTAIYDVVRAAFYGLTARTGRLIFPPPGVGSPCDVALLPTEAQTRIFFSESGPVLQVGFARTGVSVPPFDFHDFTPSGMADVEVKISNLFLRELLCCVVEKLPNFTFSAPAPFDAESDCCKWEGVTLELWPIVLSGRMELCIDGSPGMPKQIMLNGDFNQDTELLSISVSFRLPLGLHLNEVAAVTGLRLAGTPQVSVDVSLSQKLADILVSAGASTLHVPAFSILTAVPTLLRDFVRAQIQAVIDTLLSRAHALTSPVAVPPALFEAFGRLVPASIEIDDLIARGVLATPTSAWGLTPVPKLPT